MYKFLKLIIVFSIMFSIQGCLTFHTVSYEVIRNGDRGTVIVEINDIRTDTKNAEEFESDKGYLFNYALKSDEFVSDMKAEGKKIISRELVKIDGRLNGRLIYQYDDISKVEGIRYEKPYYYLTISSEDSIISSNGQIVKNEDYNRIIWDESLTSFKFKMFSENIESYKSMAEFYDR